MRNLHLALAACALLAACNSIPSEATPTLEQRRSGTGPSVVVFQSGLGDGLSVRNAVQPRAARVVTTFAYSRPGYGRSRDAGGERSPCRAAEEQRALLKQAANPGRDVRS